MPMSRMARGPRINCQQIATASLEQVLNRMVLADADLYHLSTALNEADDPESLTRAFVGLRCIGIYSFDSMSPSVDPMLSPVDPSQPLWQRPIFYLVLLFKCPSFLYYPSGMFYWDELRYLQFMDRYIAATKTACPERIGMWSRVYPSSTCLGVSGCKTRMVRSSS